MQEMPLTIGAVARRYGVPLWKLRSLYQRRLLPEAERVGIYRVIQPWDLPIVEEALRRAGYLPREAEAMA